MTNEMLEENLLSAKGERAGIHGAIRLLGASLGLAPAVVEGSLTGQSTALPMLGKESEDMAYVTDALRRLGDALSDAEIDFDGDAFVTNMMRGEPYDGTGTKLDACEQPDAARGVLTQGVPVSFSQDRSLLVWKRGDGVEVWETARHGKPVRHASVLAWLTQSAPTLHVVP